ncbi:MAG: hypothetical protein KIT49_11405 [Nitrospira sp.]|jgi:hypothetical protein|nr:hypothetical protein [Fimbriimonadaceae bacterium]MBX3120871.1 hypothetical protein [Fimbriimonadaceae bacterium]MCW5788086.1 hypothetical protein [Nitrospira sp.]HAP40768.1 hypothetical protein [Nitrospira sp.]
MLPVIISLSLLAFPCMMPTGLAAAAPAAEAALLGGTVVSIDQETLTLTILFPSGESRALPVRDARLLHGLSIGDHVTFEINGDNQLVKITKLPTDPAN